MEQSSPAKDYELEVIQLKGSEEFKEWTLESPHPYRALVSTFYRHSLTLCIVLQERNLAGTKL
jgi:hypothetical protein